MPHRLIFKSQIWVIVALVLAFVPLAICDVWADDFKISVDDVQSGKPLPKKFTADGDNVSPAVSWKGAPPLTKEFVLLVEDPDAPSASPWAHWVVYNIPASMTSLPEAFNGVGVTFGKNSWNKVGYRGPEPPKDGKIHRYIFSLYAVPRSLKLPPGLPRDAVRPIAVKSNLAHAEFTVWYKR